MPQSGTSVGLMGASIIAILAIFGVFLNNAIAWIVILPLIAAAAIVAYLAMRKKMAESYRKAFSEAESFASENGFEMTKERCILRYEFARWSGYSLAAWKGAYKGREMRIVVVQPQRSIVPRIALEDYCILIERMPGIDGKKGPASELIEGSKADVKRITLAAENLAG